MSDEYLTIEEINEIMKKPLDITEDWITAKAQQKYDIECQKKMRLSKRFK